MKFKIDHNLPVELAELIRAAGYEAATAAEQGMAEAADNDLVVRCREEARCSVTLDAGFANIKSYPPAEYPGIVVLRARHQDKLSVLAIGRSLTKLLETEPLEDRLWIVEPDRIRIHG